VGAIKHGPVGSYFSFPCWQLFVVAQRGLMITNCLLQLLPRPRWLQLPRHARADAQAEEEWDKKKWQ
jgi:hypothetical protein